MVCQFKRLNCLEVYVNCIKVYHKTRRSLNDMSYIFLFGMFLTLVVNGIECSYNCLDKCFCVMEANQKITANCTALNYSSIPQPEEHQVNILIMNFNKLSFVKRDAFMRYTLLEDVRLVGNKINIIEKEAFIGLGRSHLRRLDLSRNFLVKIPLKELKRISHSLEFLSLSYNRLRFFPAAMAEMTSLKELDVSRNSFISTMPAASFPSSMNSLNIAFTAIRKFTRADFNSLYNLKRLVMSDNLASGAVQFEQGTFDVLSNLEYLDLSRCFCRQLPPNSFVRLGNLSTLLLQSTYLSALPDFGHKVSPRMKDKNYNQSLNLLKHHPEPPLDGDDTVILRKRSVRSLNQTIDFALDGVGQPDTPTYQWYNHYLLHLDVSHNHNMKIPTQFQTTRPLFPPSLVSIDAGYTSIRRLTVHSLANLNSMENLDLSSSRLNTIADGAFSRLVNLRSVSLSKNPLEKIPELPISVQVVNMTRTRMKLVTANFLRNLTKLVSLDLSHGNVRQMENESLLTLSNLRVLNLTDNDLQELNDLTLRIGKNNHNSSLLIADLSNNAISISAYVKAFISHSKLESLYLQGNKLQEISEQTLRGLFNVKFLDLSTNMLVTVAPNAFHDLRNIEELRLGGNQLEILFEGMFRYSNQLRHLDVSKNRLIDIHEQSLPSLITVDFCHNNMTEFPMLHAPKLVNLDASENMIASVSRRAIGGIPQLQWLSLSYNENLSIRNFSSIDNARRLEVLKLVGCNVQGFIDVFMPSLKVLLLSRNSIDQVTSTIDKYLPNIEQVDLSYNELSTVSPTAFNTSKTLSSLDLKGNNFRCDCEMFPMVEWIKFQLDHQLVDVVGARGYLCETPPSLYAEMLVQTVSQLDCGTPTPPKPLSTSTLVVEIVLGLITAIAITVSIVTACYCRRRAPSQHSSLSSVNENSESEIQSPRLCCEWLAGRLMGKGRFIRSRRRVFSNDEGRDLMSTTPLATPTETEAPVEL